LATGEVRLYWYHRATGKRLTHDPESAEGLLEAAGLDAKATALEAVLGAPAGSLAALWTSYRDGPEWRALKPRTRSDYQAVRDWIGKGAESVMVRRIALPDVMKLRDKAAKQKGRRFGNYVVQVLRLVLEWGRVRGWVAENVARGAKSIRRPSGARKVNRAWSAAEIRAFASAAPPQLLLPFALGLFAGMRQGDAVLVTWSAYDGGALRWIAGKNGEDCMAPVTGAFKKILDAARENRRTTVQIATTSTGTAWTQSGFRASFFKLVRSLVAAGHMQPGCTFHGLRHTIASQARNDGASDAQVAASIGDRSTHMAAIYGRDFDRTGAQGAILEAVQKRLANIEWKTALENAAETKARRVAKSLIK
jgi:integrase